MIKKIRLDNFSIARLSEKEPFLLGVNDNLSFEFVTDKYDLRNLIVTFKNGEVSESVRIEKKTDLPTKLLFAGKLEIGIELIVNGETCKKWETVPILLKDYEKDKLQLGDYLSEIENKINALILDTNLQKDKIAELQERIKVFEARNASIIGL